MILLWMILFLSGNLTPETLGQERYRVMREKGTEKAFTGKYLYETEPGTYCCAACDNPLFESGDKYDSGAGWPSFLKPTLQKSVYYLVDTSVPFQRYEVLCRGCDSHLGHVFNDGPGPEGVEILHQFCYSSSQTRRGISMKKKICLPTLLFIGGYHLFLAIALPLYFMNYTPSAGMIWTTVALVFASGIAITSGYHRLYSHNCYKLHPAIEAVLLFLGTLATQGSAIKWAYDHRLHHSYVDTDKDPYTVKRGMWHAHILWMFWRSAPMDKKVVSDLFRKKLLAFQHKYYVPCMLVTNIGVFLAIGAIFQDYLGAFLFAFWVRMFILHHTTWCINSLAHYWGSQEYSREHTAVDNYLISLLTYGEGYHNYHHTFAYDYRNGIRWYHFDPSKWLIWTLHKLGLAYDLKRVNDYRIARHLVLQHKDELVEKLKTSVYVQKVTDIAERLADKLSKMQSILDRKQLREMKKNLRNDWKQWKLVLREIRKDSLLKA